MNSHPPETYTGELPIDIEALKASVVRAKVKIGQSLFGLESAMDELFIAFLSEGHILLEDVPGMGKTALTKAFASVLGLTFQRIQCTPDLLPGDITGGLVYQPKSGDFTLRKGPIFTNILLVDEINRALPRTQSALLEAMAEGQVTIDGTTHTLPRPFMVIATQNPLESQGVFPLPEAQLDRFLLKTSLGYPSLDEDVQILNFHLRPAVPELAVNLDSTVAIADWQSLLTATIGVRLHPDILRYIAQLIRATRTQPDVRIGASPRAMVMMAKAARSSALISGRDYVLPDDVQRLVKPLLLHRLVLQGYLESQSEQEQTWLDHLLTSVPTPLESALS